MLAQMPSLTVSRIQPEQLNGRTLVKLVYVVLEPQYQSAVAAGAENINLLDKHVAMDVRGYLIEELRDPERYEEFKRDVAEADIFFASMIFMEDYANKIVDAVKPHMDHIKSSVIFPSMPQVMRLSKVGAFSMGAMGQSKSAIGKFMKARKEASKNKRGGSFQEGMLKMVQTLPKILKYLPVDKAQDARNFMLSYQYWLGGSPENMEHLLRMHIHHYIIDEKDRAKVTFQPPVQFPDIGIWHPLATQMFTDIAEYQSWYNRRPDISEDLKDPLAPTLGLILQRTHLVTGDDGHYVAMVEEMESRGARVIPVFAGGLDASKPVEAFFYDSNGRVLVDTVVSLTGFSLVGGPAKNDPEAAIESMKKLNRPYICALPLVFQTTEDWSGADLGLHPVQVALQVALPELDGAIEPIILSGRDGVTGKAIPIADRIELVAARALKWANLRKKPRLNKKIGITVFSFPPDKGNVGTAAYLDVFASIHNVLKALQENGYDVQGVPETSHELLMEVLNDVNAKIKSQSLSVAAKMTVREYEELTPHYEGIQNAWGPAPGPFNTDGTNVLVYGKHYGKIFIGVQPSFGYEGDPMRLMFSKSCAPHHGFAAYYTYVEKIWGADAVIHFGTHGALEFMPGKQMGMSASCYPDRLIGTLPNLYYYSVNNPSEATIAKRRSYASTVSYLTPPAENAGLYKGLKELQGLIASYKDLRTTEKAEGITETIVEQVKAVNLDNDVPIPAGFNSREERDEFVGKVYKFLMEIEDRLVPCDLHVVGTPPTAMEVIDTLCGVASFDRPEDNDMKGLQRMLAEHKGLDIENIQRQAAGGSIEALDKLREFNNVAKAAVTALVQAQADAKGRVSRVSLMNFFNMGTTEPWVEGLKKAGYEIEAKELRPLFTYLEDVLARIVSDNELGALIKGLEGEYTLPGPGGDTVRNPMVLPTGKNIHALDPQSIPTAAAIKSAQLVVDRMLARHRAENDGNWPETIACVLWGTDNIKTYGEALAQILYMLGVKPVPDSIGRMNCIEIIPLTQLGRPRIDTVVTCSGIFRDLFPNQMELIDKAVKLAAEQDEPDHFNFVRKHAIAQAEELGITTRQAATRVFSNASGSYAANVNFAVENGSWETEEQLHEMYLSRKSYAFGADVNNEQQRAVYESALRTVDTTFQNLDSNETSITDVDHYFDYLGSVTGVVEKMRGKRPSVYMADTTSAQAKIRSLEEMVRLDSRTKMLNPKWYEGMLKHGYEGVREIQYRLTHTFGWSATAHAVDGWVYDETANTYMNDQEMAERLKDLNPNAFRKMVGVLLEANGRGYWETTPEQVEKLQELYQDLEDRIEGIDEPVAAKGFGF
jgi:magnesium chelatase subunit H